MEMVYISKLMSISGTYYSSVPALIWGGISAYQSIIYTIYAAVLVSRPRLRLVRT